jgi:hypothetical protein
MQLHGTTLTADTVSDDYIRAVRETAAARGDEDVLRAATIALDTVADVRGARATVAHVINGGYFITGPRCRVGCRMVSTHQTGADRAVLWAGAVVVPGVGARRHALEALRQHELYHKEHVALVIDTVEEIDENGNVIP